MTSAVTDVPWQELKHAFGRASDIPQLLAAVSQARGGKLRKRMEELWERVLHQGSIYSASPPAVAALIPMAANVKVGDRRLFYEVLAEFASSARQALRDGRAIPCCSGGDPEHGRAILAHLLDARDQFAPDVGSRDATVRGLAGGLLCCSPDAGSEAAELVRRQFDVEKDAATRMHLLEAVARVGERLPDWAGFLAATLELEPDAGVRFALRDAQIRQMKSAADEAAVAELISLFLADCETGYGSYSGSFFEVLALTGEERELAGLLQALEGCRERNVLRQIAERLLRLVFHDQRTGWESVSHRLADSDGDARAARGANNGLPSSGKVLRGLLKIALLAVLWKIFPFLLRRRLRRNKDAKNRRRYQVDYWEVKGDKPEVPAVLTADQQRVLAALTANAEVWIDQTNLWALFGLPDNAEDVRKLAA